MATTDEILMKYQDGLAKAVTSEADMQTANMLELAWEDAVGIWGGVETPLLSRCAAKRCKAVTHYWRDAQQTAPTAADVQITGTASSGLTGKSIIPVRRSNTCELVMGLIEVTGSNAQEARNGVYGADMMDSLAFQLSLEGPRMVQSIAYDAWFNLEVTEASALEASAREMSGLVGTVGSGGFDDGLLTTTARSTVTTNSGAAFDEDVFCDWLAEIAVAGAGAMHRPTAVYCSLNAQRKISQFANMVNLTVNVNDLAALSNLPAGQRVTKYVAPWGAVIDIVYEPQNAHSATAANNWMAALCEPDISICNFRGTVSEGGIVANRLPYVPDKEQLALLWEGTIEAQVFKGHGVLHNFTVSL